MGLHIRSLILLLLFSHTHAITVLVHTPHVILLRPLAIYIYGVAYPPSRPSPCTPKHPSTR